MTLYPHPDPHDTIPALNPVRKGHRWPQKSAAPMS
jgi:hypothetical protein